MANTKLFDTAMKAFDEALDWQLFNDDPTDATSRFFFDDITELHPNEGCLFIAGTMNHSGATITIKADHNATLKSIIQRVLNHYKGILSFDNEGYGVRQNYVYMGGNNDTIYDFIKANNLPYAGVQFTVTGEPSVLEESDKAATIYVKFNILDFEPRVTKPQLFM